VYDMYPWNASASASAASQDASDEDATGTQAGPDPKPVQAVQVALDRRDNGGQATGTPALTRQ
jgi:hypothetical protein